ncbi:Glu/Leu/Phe/Val dehydrogenase dimerization domain-containing protein [Paenibacillus validus]|uniref:Amino acid dehydrogenase n=1 Tax=Paenibacillus validus TaxID=44253 RepID=A0A7X2Z8J7_9BACL|nr:MULTISPECIES: Glu/Leu/Phe/Val dehydrogenase dimerization domain-containing protein [Paenibacillus]MED4602213.1 Glu/Leu/Phe/Val dehydrogenase dimerization domain-containing protein [Paenibacillus validus]MED4607379.1 Glu/Leu/Phe/Val dehydrogenase dimerization domain-containing protein [Paenibacillus validus]MUG70236.1 amino acid dehydrogenase [Paenibacillus validus]
MEVWKEHFEQLIFLQDQPSGLKAIIAIHNTKLGAALGGCRMWHYASEEDAVRDALRLAKGMTYKSAISGLPYGGGKAVILGPPDQRKHELLFRALGRYIESLQGRYITGMDLGTSVADMDWIRLETTYVTDTTGSLGATGDLTAAMTAYGVYLGIRASLKRVFGTETFIHRTVAVQGLGKVGYQLCRYLKRSGAKLVVSDVNPSRRNQAVKDFGAHALRPDEIVEAACDVFSPCALGGIINDLTLPRLRCRIVAGAANNQLAEKRHGHQLHKLGILYAPDYIINAGGIIVTSCELNGSDAAFANKQVENIYRTLTNVFDYAGRKRIPTSEAADERTEQLLAAP